jgi:phosphoribosylformylglycinamidine synthase
VKARVFVTLKPSILDPQGGTIRDALRTIGYVAVNSVRQGKYFEVDLDVTSPEEAQAMVDEFAEKLLVNPVIESYRLEVDE